MKFQIPHVYPITDTRLSGLSHLEQVRRMAAGGASVIQLRDKEASPLEFYEAARDVVEFARRNSLSIIINDRVDIAIAVGADGIHLGQDDMPPELARKAMGDDAIIGYSTHSVKQAKLAAVLPINYVAIGPIFYTGTKKDTDPVVGLQGLHNVRAVVGDLPIVAIGGVTAENLRLVLDAGADSAAMISELVGNGDMIEHCYRRVLDFCEQK